MGKKQANLGGSRSTLLWNKKVPNSELEKFKKVVEKKYDLHFDSYWDLHKWSIENYASFWEEIWNYFGVIVSKPYDKVGVKTGDGFLDYDWFRGAEFNLAENLMRIRDDRIALICLDETGHEEKVTYAQVFEEAKQYAAAFRKHGLKKGDAVACYMSNRKEAVFAMLATTSIGAIWSGPQPYIGARIASNIIGKIEPKFLIAVDHHQDNGVDYNIIENLPVIVKSCPTLQKIIIIPSKVETKIDGISHIEKSIFLEDFLRSGRNPDGSIPDIIFEQLSYNHPAFLNFTSGTVGLPKGVVHSAGMGWSVWECFMPSLALGITILLYCGSLFWIRDGINIWDLLAKYKVNYCSFLPSMLDKLENFGVVPSPNSNLENLRMILIGGSPVKVQNIKFVQSIVGKNTFIGILYGATERFGRFTGVDLNLPAYAGEIQVPALGMDLRIVDETGQPLIGEKGEIIFSPPCPGFPVCLWKDIDHTLIKEIYLSKYPGYWCQHDIGWINPETKGLIITGRSDDTLIQNGDRFAAADVYFAIHGMEEIMDYICVNQSRKDGECRAVLFVKLKPGYTFTPELRRKIARTIDKELWEDCVPQIILEVPDIPYSVNNKRLESVVRKIVANNEIPQMNNVRNPECLKYFCNIPDLLNYDI
ncbi:acetoacetyl-CoA synthetase-like isoform X2 [Stegodyphus dumicola]|uniref:acetoacetyl-CoA synthetase-like isoform X2 n=1 Tax=Stegodyphus dumicola TaxID=202533 RepID=UPI0015B355D5|nr:acetoacetyl-CoA synthetase-like isoform X2 [Stegodyphus dumicola]